MNHETAQDDRRICKPGTDDDKAIKIDKQFEHLMPPLSASELADLHRSIDAEKTCRDALIMWKGKNTLVDGHNRLRYCRKKGYSYPVIDKEFPSKEAVKAYIVQTNLARRNLLRVAESYLRGKRYLERKRQGARTDLDKTSGKIDQKSTSEQMAKEFKVGEKTIRLDGKLAEAVDLIVKHCGDQARNVTLARESGMNRGAVLRLAQLKPAEQRKYLNALEKGKKPGKKPREKSKAKKDQIMKLPRRPIAMANALVKQFKPADLERLIKALEKAMRTPRKSGSKESGRKGENGGETGS